jgi:class 3 adenylate cyclase
MSVGVNSGLFHFFLVGGSHRELVVTGPATTGTVLMESTATAGEILLAPATAEHLPAKVLGAEKGPGRLLRSEPPGLSRDGVEAEEAAASVDLPSLIPVGLRESVLAGTEPEHRSATVAFVHFDGTDALLEEQGADAVASALDHLVRDVQRAVDEHGVCFLGSDIDADGGKLILTAGVPKVLGDDEERMLLALRAIIDSETAVPIRIGVNRGHVFAGDIGPSYRRTYTVMGDAVNLAARVMAKAEPGQLLATEPVLNASGIAFNEIALDPFLVKGKSKPIQASIVGAPTGAKPTGAVEELPLVGRETELAALGLAIEGLNDGRGSLIEIVGNPGIGKTRLLNELRQMAEGLPQLLATCHRYESSTPYQPLRRLFRLLLGTEADDTIADRLRLHVESTAPELLPWLPLLAVVADVDVPMTPEVEQLGEEFRKPKLEEVTTEFLSRVIKEPTLVALEDAHWMDEGSRDLLEHVARRIGEFRWLVCVTRRDEETGFVAPGAEGASRSGPVLVEEEAEG